MIMTKLVRARLSHKLANTQHIQNSVQKDANMYLEIWDNLPPQVLSNPNAHSILRV